MKALWCLALMIMACGPAHALVASSQIWARDTQDYCNRTAVTNSTVRGQLLAFSQHLDQLSLFQSVRFFPMRSTQTLNSATVAQGMGRLTLSNGVFYSATWGTNGLSSTGNMVMEIGGLTGTITNQNSISTIIVGQIASSGTMNFAVLRGGGFNQTGDNYVGLSRAFNFMSQHQIYLTGGTANKTIGSFASFTNTGMVFMASSRTNLSTPSTTTGFVYRDGTTNGTVSGTGDLPSTNPYGAAFYVYGVGAADYVVAFALVGPALTASQIDSIRSMYKTTLGSGLGLP